MQNQIAHLLDSQPANFANKPTAATDNIVKLQISAQGEKSCLNDAPS